MPDASAAPRLRIRSSAGRHLLHALVTVLTALLALAVTAGTADAHTSVSGSSPANGATVQTLDSLSIEFVDPVLDRFAGIVMTTEDDQRVPLSDPVVNGRTITSTVPGPPPAPGLYIVSYRAVSVDGHTITGSLAFTFDPTGTTADATGAPSATPTPSPSPPVDTTAAAGNGGSGSAALVLGIGVGVALLAGVGLWAARQRTAR